MKLGNPAELLGEQLGHLPLIWKDVESGTNALSGLLEDALKPCKSSSSVFEARVRFARSKWLFVRLKELSAELDSQFVHRTFSDCIEGEASLEKLFFLTAFANAAEIFQDLEPQFFTKSVSFNFDLCNLLGVLHVVFKVDEQFICRIYQVGRFFVPLLHASVAELLDSLN